MADNPMTHPSPEAVERAMKCAETLERSFSSEDMTRGEQSAITLRAHVTALTDQLAVEQKRRQDIDFAFVTCANDKAALTAQLEAERATGDETARHISRLLDHLTRETARADAAEAEAKDAMLANAALREALKEVLSWHDYTDDMHKPVEVRAAYMRARATLAQPAADGGATP